MPSIAGEEEVVVREAEVGRERAALEPFDGDVLKLSTKMSSSSSSVDAPGSSIWIHVAPRSISASRFGRMMFRAMSSVSSRGGVDLVTPGQASAEAARLRQVVLVVRPDGERVGARDRDLQLVASRADWRKENSSLWYGSPSETGPTAADFE